MIAQSIGIKINGISPKKEFDGNGNCFIELVNGKAGYASGNFYSEPKPVVKIKIPSRFRYWSKVQFEKW